MSLIKPKVSIIIPTFNAAENLPILLSSIFGQTEKSIEVIVIDSQSSDDTLKIACKYGVRVIRINKSNFDHGGTRNYAASKALGNILVYLTQDAVLYNETISNLIKPLNNSEIIVSYARQVPKPGTKLTDKFLRMYNYPPHSIIKSREDILKMGIKTFQSSNVCCGYRKKEFEDLGCFPEPVVCNEDMLFAAQAILSGYKVSYTAEAVVVHSHNYNYIELFKRYFDIGASLDNQPIIKKFAKEQSKGCHFVLQQIKYLRQENKLINIPDVIIEALFKFTGYKLGKNHHHIPQKVKKYLGLNTGYWLR